MKFSKLYWERNNLDLAKNKVILILNFFEDIPFNKNIIVHYQFPQV